MAYAEFTLAGLTSQFNLTTEEETDLYAAVPEVRLRESFREQLNQTVPLALKVSTEKARSEWIIGPVLTELWLLTHRKIGLFSGVEFNVDAAQGLTGVCDYIITRSPEQYFIKAPVLLVVEAKKEDMTRGYGQCLGEMLGAQTFNARQSSEAAKVHGAVTIGERWKFLELEGTIVRIDAHDYFIEHVAKILGILLHLVGDDAHSRNNNGR